MSLPVLKYPTNNISSKNYSEYRDSIYIELIQENKYITDRKILDIFYDRNLINKNFYQIQKRIIYKNEKFKELTDYIISLSISSVLLTIFLFIIFPYYQYNKYIVLIYISYLIFIYMITIFIYYQLYYHKDHKD